MMTAPRRIGFWGCVLLASVVAGCNQADRDEIRQVHAAFDRAFVDQNGSLYASMLAQPSLDYYKRVLSYAQHATREQVMSSPATERFQILLARHYLSRQQMADLNGKEYVEMSINEGWFDPINAWTETITDIRFQGENVASAEIVLDGERTEARYGFIREDEQWKVDDTLMDQVYDRWTREEAEYRGVSENQLIIGWIDEMSGGKVSDSIWDPPK